MSREVGGASEVAALRIICAGVAHLLQLRADSADSGDEGVEIWPSSGGSRRGGVRTEVSERKALIFDLFSAGMHE